MNLKFLFILVFIPLACNNTPSSCVNAELDNYITIKGFRDLKKDSVDLYRRIYGVNGEVLENIPIKNIESYTDASIGKFELYNLEFSSPLFSQENYRLIINSKEYDISDIEISRIPFMKGIYPDTACNIRAFKINGKKAKIIYFDFRINFENPIDKRN